MAGELHYCSRCGAALVAQRDDEGHTRLACSDTACGRVVYRNAKPCAGVLVERADGCVLLVQRAWAPYKGVWDIPGGFLEEWEHPAEAAVRELREETGLDVELTALLGIFIDRYGPEDYNTLNVYYRGRIIGGHAAPADDAAALGWFAPDALPLEMAFPDHERQVLAAWQVAIDRDPQPTPGPEMAIWLGAGVVAQRQE